jgi:phospholipase/lecithinase/hemolysin
MQELYAMGARKFAIVNAALIGCTPAARVVSQPLGACAEGANLLAAGFNVALRSLLATDLAPRLPGLVYSLADSFVLMKDFFADPPAWGFTDIASACCGDGFLLAQSACLPTSKVCPTRYERDQHIFWDNFHFSQRASFLTAQAFYDGPSKYTTPINFMQLAQSI